MKKSSITIALLSVVLLTSCKISDVRKGTDLLCVNQSTHNDQEKGKQILTAYINKNGYHKFNTADTYEIKAHEEWKGMMGKMGNPWPENKVSYRMKFIPHINAFKMEAELTSKKQNGDLWGLKSLSSPYYKEKGKTTKNLNEGKMSFNLANYQWWIEFPNRLSQAENITYAGVKEKEGQLYDLVLATWGNSLKPSKTYDQYMIWFNKSTGLIDMVTFTFRNVPMMMPPFMYGTAYFRNYKMVDGINLPFSHKFQINGPSKETKFAHHFLIDNVVFDSFNKGLLE